MTSISFGLAKAVDSLPSPKRLLLLSLIELDQALVISELYVVLYKPRAQLGPLFFCKPGVFERGRMENPILHTTRASNSAHIVVHSWSLDTSSVQYNRYVMSGHRVPLSKVRHRTISGLVLCGFAPGRLP